jgi:hypothetical protein
MATQLSWCDKLASVPTAGFKLDPHFASSDSIIDCLSSVLDPQMRGDRTTFTVLQQSTFDFQFQTDAGYHYSIDATRAVVAFRHKLRTKATSGGPPIMEMLSQPQPYTKLLREVSDRLLEATVLLAGTKKRTVTRIGIMATTTVAVEEAPPGIERFIHYIGRPWRTSTDHFNINVLADLKSEDGWKDRCIHMVNKPEDPEQLMTVTLDWQRVFTTPKPITTDAFAPIMQDCQKSALAYFEEVAEGSLFDEKLISEAAARV